MNEGQGGQDSLDKDGKAGHNRRNMVIAGLIALVIVIAAVCIYWFWRQPGDSQNSSAPASTASQARKDAGKKQRGKEPSPSSTTTSQVDKAQSPDAATAQNSSQGSACAQYQGQYHSLDMISVTLLADCSIRFPDHTEVARQVDNGAPGVSQQVPQALDILMVNPHHAVVYSLFPAGVGVGYPGEDVSHNRLANHSGGPFSAMTHDDFRQLEFVAD